MYTACLRWIHLPLLVYVLAWASPAQAAELLAVLELSGALPADQRRALTNAVEAEATNLSPAEYHVMTSENMKVMLADMGLGSDCGGVHACEVEIFRNLGLITYGVTGKVTDSGGTYSVILQLYEMRGGTMLGAEAVKSSNPLELVKTGVPAATRKLLAALPGVDGTAVAAPVQPAADVSSKPTTVDPPIPPRGGSGATSPTDAAAARTGRLAVLEIRTKESVDGIEILSDEVRGAVMKSAGAKLHVMTRENMEVMLADMDIDASCVAEGACEVETARNLNADFVITGMLATMSGKQVLSLKMHETKTGTLVGQERTSGDDVLSLLDKVGPMVETLLKP